MDTRWLLISCCILLLGVCSVWSERTKEQQAALDKYEAAIMEQMAKLKALGKEGQDKDAMKNAMDSVQHLKPEDLPVQDLIALMGRVFQSQLGLNINVKDQDQLDKDAAAAKAEQEAKKEKKKKKKQDKKTKKGPSMSKNDEL